MDDRTAPKTYPTIENEADVAVNPNSAYAKLLALVSAPANVLDVGCGPGNFSRILAAQGNFVTGIDISGEHILQAQEHCVRAEIADLETVSLSALLSGTQYDYVVCADILEHVRNPEHLLRELRPVFASEGFLLASIPNIAHGAVRLALLLGDFDYQPFGLLDDTHVRFFTRKSILELFANTGYTILTIERVTMPIFDPANTLVPVVDRAAFPEDAVALVEADPEGSTLQFIVKAVPAL